MAKGGQKNFISSVKRYISKNYRGWLYVSPVVLGVLIFTLYPMISSLYDSFFSYNVLKPRVWNNFKNYIYPFTRDWEKFSKSLEVTGIYTVVHVTLSVTLSFALALMLNRKLKGIKIIRTLFYLPVMIPVVISGLMWRNVLDVEYGFLNSFLTQKLHFEPLTLLSSPKTSLVTVISLNFFSLGSSLLLWLSSMKGISAELYEYADIEGANVWTKIFKITVPMCSPMIFYNLIMGIITSLQTFNSVYVLTNGTAGPKDSLLFFVTNIYVTAFGKTPQIGYASALSWILFVIIGLLTTVVFKTSRWVFYNEEA